MAREASAERNTKETEIKLKINLDGTGYSDIETGVGVFNHMLDGFTRHGLFDLSVRVHGDLQVDDHHTIEDTGIVLGTALKEAIALKSDSLKCTKYPSTTTSSNISASSTKTILNEFRPATFMFCVL